ncbi:MAG: replication protein RepA [Betaproteobacteria bacterium]|nr:replication protein RepA [Betaproteobacteria bacterium]
MWSPNGLPYGSIPRMLLAWITTEAIRTKNPTLVLGHSLSEFMRQLDMPINGGTKGGITRLREQMKRLFATTVVCTYNDALHDKGRRFDIADDYDLWWHPQQADQAGLWESTLTLSQKFYAEVVASPVPIDLQALKALKRSPMALDIYLWLTFRNSYLKASTVITWDQLQMQFGAEYGRSRDFKEAFSDALRKVLVVYPAAKIVTNDRGILISPSPTHVSKQGKKLSKK